MNPAQIVTKTVTKDKQIKAQRSLKKRNDFMMQTFLGRTNTLLESSLNEKHPDSPEG
jgi:hypothetical protein